ncbi:hypothetical protein ACFQX6_20075 [Streptosporangium lutulentum]
MSSRHRISIRTRITLFAGAVAALLCSLVAVLLMIAIERFVTGSLTGEIIAAGGRVAVEVERGQLEYPSRSARAEISRSSTRRAGSSPRPRSCRANRPWRRSPPTARTSPTPSCAAGSFPPRMQHRDRAAAHRAGQSWIVYSASPVVPRGSIRGWPRR